MAEVILKGVSKSFGDTVGVADIDMTIPDGAFVVLLGPTGAGKTTTLRLISGLETLDAGEISIGGRVVNGETPAQRDVAMVFQQYSLYPHLTVRENLEFPLKSPILNTPKDEITRKVTEVAQVLQISHKLDNKATALSGGEMQRVSIGRALVRDPQVYLMDEPLSSLDAKLRTDLRIELKRIQASLGATILYVTRGDDYGDPCVRAERWASGAVRHPARHLRKPELRLCCLPPRSAAHQYPARRPLWHSPKRRASDRLAA